VEESPTLAVDERVREARRAGKHVVHLGFGEAGLPVLPEVMAELAAASPLNAYGPVAGSWQAREAAASWFARRDLPTDPDVVVFGPGSKALLFALVSVLPGDLVLPQPSWVSYAAQAALAAKRTLRVPIPPAAGGVPDPDELDRAIRRWRTEGADPGILLVTVPDNPTGTMASPDLVRRTCEVARDHGLVVISDEIYRDLAFEPAGFLSPATVAPEHVVVTSGLSKSMALGGWRIGYARLPDGGLGHRLRADLTAVASEIWSALAAPMQRVAAYVLGEPEPVRHHIEASRRLHATVTRAVYDVFAEAGATARPPQAAFYLYPDFEPLRPDLVRRGVATGADLARWLFEERNVAVLPGTAFGDAQEALRIRVAASQLYGTDDARRWETLDADDPLALPWVRGALKHVAAALEALTG
jgi:aspartate aminotransferase